MENAFEIRGFMIFSIRLKILEEKWKVRIISCFEWSDVQR
ncbi:hypothetical protein bthur0003_49040 [Bacillus thuringiensis serovar thuringiensis str. T01001]|nr:hypothetical protein CT43_CH5120 [Bacillus thuringiensis serovar chinensis CT-43]AGG03911.1 hypothetical protein H175_ch5202 [Bacillus thuringiensis serovar thuringiensis str. IS5056]EEM26179.1 hypothetical protein bthur0002_49540 [Bacillus thuringiensis Bt407]EEM32697.1 hypothetical protein bthur0003_49040 [Bacillus thuringiensis serovar thuringiensis str. T01001]QBZ28066.1 hypothetical protein FORC085_5016 [Bacillus cereus]